MKTERKTISNVPEQQVSMRDRIKITHDKHCSNWETWQSWERDWAGHKFLATQTGCRKCGVAILERETDGSHR